MTLTSHHFRKAEEKNSKQELREGEVWWNTEEKAGGQEQDESRILCVLFTRTPVLPENVSVQI